MDDNGNKYNIDNTGGWGREILPPNVPVIKTLKIPDFDTSATKFTILRFNMRDTGNGENYGIDQFEIRDLPTNFKAEETNQTASAKPERAEITAADIDVKITSARLKGTTATIEFLMTNRTKRNIHGSFSGDEPMSRYPYKTMAIDDHGNQLRWSEYNSYSKVGFSSTYIDLPTDIPVKFTVRINDVDENAQTLPFVGIAFRGIDADTSYGVAYLKLHDVRLSR